MIQTVARFAAPVRASLALAATLGAVSMAFSATLTFSPTKDNTLYENDGGLSNGRGAFLFSGRTNAFGLRRAVLAFDVASAIPPGSTITSATLTLHVSATISAPQKFFVHRLFSDWGESSSDAGFPGGGGAPAEPGDATWTHAFWPSTTWSSAGGDYDPAPSASRTLGGIGTYTLGPTPELVTDVQDWVDTPGANYGWILIGDESGFTSAYRFDSRESTSAPIRPVLTVGYTAPPGSAGAVPDGQSVPGAPLTIVSAGGGNLALNWSASCHAGDTDYEVYEGSLGSYASHVPILCSTGGATTATITPTPGDSHYYLVVPRSGTKEGSYGKNSGGSERPRGPASCLPQAIAGCM